MTATQPEEAAGGGTSRWRVLLMLALAGAVLSVGARIPLPGLEPSEVASYLAASPGGGARLSVLALGILPLLSVLLLLETAKLVLPGFAAWSDASPRRRRAVRVAITAATLVLAAMQAAGISQALVQSGLAVDDGLSALATVASLVAGVAVLVALAERIHLPDLPQAGFWLVLSLPLIVCAGLLLLGDLLPVPLPAGSALIALAVVSWSIGRAIRIGIDPSGTAETGDRRERTLPACDDPVVRGG